MCRLRRPRMMIHRGALREAELPVVPYFCRVPTHSNLADGPSRNDFELCLRLGAVPTLVDHQMLRSCALVDRLGADVYSGCEWHLLDPPRIQALDENKVGAVRHISDVDSCACDVCSCFSCFQFRTCFNSFWFRVAVNMTIKR